MWWEGQAEKGAVRIMAERAGGKTLPVPGRTACGGVVMTPAGKTPKTKGKRRQVNGAHGVFPDREKVVREGVNEDIMQMKHQSRIDFSGKQTVEG